MGMLSLLTSRTWVAVITADLALRILLVQSSMLAREGEKLYDLGMADKPWVAYSFVVSVSEYPSGSLISGMHPLSRSMARFRIDWRGEVSEVRCGRGVLLTRRYRVKGHTPYECLAKL